MKSVGIDDFGGCLCQPESFLVRFRVFISGFSDLVVISFGMKIEAVSMEVVRLQVCVVIFVSGAIVVLSTCLLWVEW